MRFISFLFFLLLALLGVSFALLNAQPVHINYYIGQHDLPLSLLLVSILLLGILLGWLAILPSLIALRFKVHRLNKQIRLSQQDTLKHD